MSQSDALNSDLLLAYAGLLITATISVYAGSHGSLPVSPPSVMVSVFNRSSSLFGIVPRSRKVAERARVMARMRTILQLG